jgi:hypothetical protein
MASLALKPNKTLERAQYLSVLHRCDAMKVQPVIIPFSLGSRFLHPGALPTTNQIFKWLWRIGATLWLEGTG